MAGEFELIARHFTRPVRRAALGVGDDCALLQPAPGMQLAVSCDMLVEGRHFLSTVRARAAGPQGAGGQPERPGRLWRRAAGLHAGAGAAARRRGFLAGFAQGLFALADAHGIELVGGDTTAGPLNICITVFGEVPAGQALLRSGARAGRRPLGQRHAGRRAAGAGGLSRHRRAGRRRLRRPCAARWSGRSRAWRWAWRCAAWPAAPSTSATACSATSATCCSARASARCCTSTRCRAAPCWPRSRWRCSAVRAGRRRRLRTALHRAARAPRRRAGGGRAGRRGGHALRRHRGRHRAAPAGRRRPACCRHLARLRPLRMMRRRRAVSAATLHAAPPGALGRARLRQRPVAAGRRAPSARCGPGSSFLLLDRWLGDVGWGVADRGRARRPACGPARVTARHLGIADPGAIVWDEVVAFWLVLWLVTPASAWDQLLAVRAVPLFRRRQARPGGLGRPAVQAAPRPGHRLAPGLRHPVRRPGGGRCARCW